MASFLAELKRRKVFQVAATYAVVAWLLIQVVVTIEGPLGIPDWFDTFVIICLAVGFPITLIFSWAYDLTPSGAVRDGSIASSEHGNGRRLEYVLIGLLAVAVAWALYRVEVSPSEKMVEVVEQSDGTLPNSVAVLPFENLSPDPDSSYFAAGIHASTLNQLTKIRDLNVIARSSVMQYQGTTTAIPDVAKALKVEMVMEGSVRYANGRAVIGAQLVDGRSGTQLWSKEYDEELVDIFTVQADIANRIVTSLQAELLPNVKESISRAPSNSPEAYTAFLKAITYTKINSDTSYDDSAVFQQHLDEAIEADPGFALAHAYKAIDFATSLIRTYPVNVENARNVRERLAIEHAERALELDPTIGLAHDALAQVHRFSWRWVEAQEAFERAVQLSPNDSQVLGHYVTFLAGIGEPEKAIDLAHRVGALNPVASLPMLYTVAWISGDYESGVTAARNHILASPLVPGPHRMLGWFLAMNGDEDSEATASLNRAVELGEDMYAVPTWMLAELAYIHGKLGRAGDAQKYFNALERLSADYNVGTGNLALARLAIGNIDGALDLLNAAAEKMKSDAGWRSLEVIALNSRNDPILNRPDFTSVRRNLCFGLGTDCR